MPDPKNEKKPTDKKHQEDMIDEASKESFPASDSPAYTPPKKKD